MKNQITKLETLKKIHILLKTALIQASTELEKAGAIQYFETSYELSWKTLRQALFYLGQPDINTPRNVFREAARAGLIDDPVVWFAFIDARNQTVHTYDQDMAEQIWHMLPTFETELQKIIIRLEKLQ